MAALYTRCLYSPIISQVHLCRDEKRIQYHQLRSFWPCLYNERRCTRHSRDAVLYLPYCSRRRCGSASVQSAQTSDCQYEGALIPPPFRCLALWPDTQRQSMICELLFPSSIQAVKMNRKTLVIVLETEIYIYDISNMRLLHVIETMPNPEGEGSHLLSTLCTC